MERRIAVIGAGVSGLLACKYTIEKGFRPIVFEADAEIGGVWPHTVETAKLQTPKELYRFSDFPWPSLVKDDFPNHIQVLDYLKSYASHFDLIRYIKFNSKVISIEYVSCGCDEDELLSWRAFDSKGKWEVTVQDTLNQSTQIYEVEFVILCIGRFSGVPNYPEFPPNKGPEVFHGKVLHSMDYSAMEDADAAQFIKGKHVTIVGNSKSGLEIANECAATNGIEQPCTLMYKTEQWTIPYFNAYLALLYFNRFAELMVHKPGEGFLLYLLATFLSPLRWVFAKFVETDLKSKLPLKKYNWIPEHGFELQVSSCTLVVMPEKFFYKVEEGSIVLKKFKNLSFCKEGLIVDEHEKSAALKTDIVIFATGYKGDQKLKAIFSAPKFQNYIIRSADTRIPLYRECIHPRIPQLAIIGYSESFSNLYTSEMRCRWVSHFLEGTFKLPSIDEMEKDVLEWEKYMKKYSGLYHRRSCIGALHIWYNDQLCKDMGFNPKRKKGFLAELFEPYGPMDYANLTSK